MWASWSVGVVAKLPFVACLSKLMAHLHKTENSIFHVTREGGGGDQWLSSDCIEFLVIEWLPKKIKLQGICTGSLMGGNLSLNIHTWTVCGHFQICK